MIAQKMDGERVRRIRGGQTQHEFAVAVGVGRGDHHIAMGERARCPVARLPSPPRTAGRTAEAEWRSGAMTTVAHDKEIVLTITQEDIDMGIANRQGGYASRYQPAWGCPVACALQKLTGSTDVRSFDSFFSLDGTEFDYPIELSRAIWAFDERGIMDPGEYTLVRDEKTYKP